MTKVNYKSVNKECGVAAERIVPALPAKPENDCWDAWIAYHEDLKERDFSAEIDAEVSTWDWVNDPTLRKSVLKTMTRYWLKWIKEEYEIVNDFDNLIVFLYLKELLTYRVKNVQIDRLSQTRQTVLFTEAPK